MDKKIFYVLLRMADHLEGTICLGVTAWHVKWLQILTGSNLFPVEYKAGSEMPRSI